jgi:hypothetical protein
MVHPTGVSKNKPHRLRAELGDVVKADEVIGVGFGAALVMNLVEVVFEFGDAVARCVRVLSTLNDIHALPSGGVSILKGECYSPEFVDREELGSTAEGLEEGCFSSPGWSPDKGAGWGAGEFSCIWHVESCCKRVASWLDSQV